MATFLLPAILPVSGVGLRLEFPGQHVHRSIYSGSQQILVRGHGRWAGSVEISETTAEGARAMESLLASLRQAEHVLQLPIERPHAGTLADGTNLVATASLDSDGNRVLRMPGSGTAFVAGDYVTAGDRLFLVRQQHANGSWKVEPNIAIPDDSPVEWAEPFVRARLVGEPATSWRRPDFRGPWQLAWEEAA